MTGQTSSGGFSRDVFIALAAVAVAAGPSTPTRPMRIVRRRST